MLAVVSELVLQYWTSPNRRLANTLLALALPLILIVLSKLLAMAIHRHAINSLPFRNLRGKTIILFAPSMEAIGLEMVEELSKRGARLLIALPSPVTEPTNLQLVLLLRDRAGESSEIFLEQCRLDSAEDTLRFARQYLDAARLPTHASRLDSLVFLPHHHRRSTPDDEDDQKQQAFLLLNILLPYLLPQLESGPPVRVVHLQPSPTQAALYRSFQLHLPLPNPLILISTPPSASDALWAILAPLATIKPGLFHLRRKPRLFQQPPDPQLLNDRLKSVEAFIQSSIKTSKKPS